MLVQENWSNDSPSRREPFAFPGGAALRDHSASRVWILIDDERVARFGPALAWARQAGAAELHVLVSPVIAGVVARRAAEFGSPPSVWAVQGRTIVPATPSEPPPSPQGLAADAEWPECAELFRASGTEPVVEHGVLRAEVLGLEVARVVGGRFEVGVGRYDRVARAEMRVGQDPGAALAEAVAAVRARRRPGAAPHPANTLARSRWLRTVICSRPDLAGAVALEPVEPPLPWIDLSDAGAAPCAGAGADGSPLVVVCSVGVDLDLVPTAADCRLLHRPSAVLRLAVPEGDDLPVIRSLAAALARPAEVVTVPRRWESLQASEPSTST